MIRWWSHFGEPSSSIAPATRPIHESTPYRRVSLFGQPDRCGSDRHLSFIYAAGHFARHPIYLWVVSPYALCAAALMLPGGVSRRRVMAGCATAFAMLIFTFLFYVEGLVRSTSSTSPLIVIFAPIYLIVGGAALWAVVYTIGWKWIDVREESQ